MDDKEPSAGERDQQKSCVFALHIAVLLFVLIAGSMYVWHYLDRGWWPNNAGAFALSAERVLHGELPHRDFDEIYTGGLNYLHALSFKVLGTDFASMRRVLFLLFLTWIPAVYYIATRFTSPMIAGLASLLAVAWSLPIYSEPIASWYNLFLATHGAAALLRYGETDRRKWLFIAGALGGLSCLAKIIGLYFLAAAGLCVLFWEQRATRQRSHTTGEDNDAKSTSSRWSLVYTSVLVTGLLTFVVFLTIGIRRYHGLNGVAHFVAPIAMLAAFLIWNEFSETRTSSVSRFRTLWRLLAPVASGVCLIVGLYLLPYVLSSSLGDLVHGLFVSPRERFRVTSNSPPDVPFLAVLAVLWIWRFPAIVYYGVAGILIVPLAVFVWHGGSSYYPSVILSIRILVPIVVVSGIVLLALKLPADERGSPPARETTLNAQNVFTVLAVTGLCSLVQFPVAETIYIYFIAPLGVLALLAVFSRQPPAARPLLAVLLLFYLVFTVVWINTSIHIGVGYPPYVADEQTEIMDIDRAGGIRVSGKEKEQYETLVAEIRERCSGDYIFATPDCPEVYFLSGFRNPTRITYDFFDDPQGRTGRIKRALLDKDVRVVVLNRKPQYSLSEEELNDFLRSEYPQATKLGSFEVRWKP